jgi:SulP family sulfate permease
MAGLIMTLAGALRLGTAVRFIPHSVVTGFTAGIATIIFASQLKELFGLTLTHEPGPFLPKLAALAAAAGTASLPAIAVSVVTLGIILGLRRWRPTFPGMVVAVILCAAGVALLQLPVATIGSRFGDMAGGLPFPSLPAFSFARCVALLPDALALALLGCIESLLSAVVADGMTGGRHHSNSELLAQGVANIASVSFGGIPVTGAVARTATNIRAGGRTPVSGMLHALFVLLFMAVAAPLARFVPLAALGGVLAIVAWNMAGWREIRSLLRSRSAALVMAVTYLLTVFYDLTAGIAAGVALSYALAFVLGRRKERHTETV